MNFCNFIVIIIVVVIIVVVVVVLVLSMLLESLVVSSSWIRNCWLLPLKHCALPPSLIRSSPPPSQALLSSLIDPCMCLFICIYYGSFFHINCNRFLFVLFYFLLLPLLIHLNCFYFAIFFTSAISLLLPEFFAFYGCFLDFSTFHWILQPSHTLLDQFEDKD